MKILFIISSFGGGPGDVLKELLEYNQKNEIYCISLCQKYEKDILKSIEKNSKQYWILNKKRKFSFTVFQKIKTIVDYIKPNVIYSFDFASSVYSYFFIKNIKWFPMIRGLESAFVWWRVIIEKVIFKKANCLIVPSNALYKKVLQYKLIEKNKLIRIYNGVKISNLYKKINLKKEKFIIGMIANFYDEVKGHKYAIELIKIMPNNFKLYLIGDGRLKKEIEQDVLKKNLAKKVKFLGFLPKYKIFELLLNEIDILIVPSLSESFGKVIIEAMSIGVPVVAFNVGGIPEIIEDNKTGFLVDVKNVPMMKEKILELLNNENKYIKFSLNSIKRVKELFDVEIMAKEYFKVLND
jgi:glycosyltransferase involved in cell wall biosynthesis